MLTQKRVIFLGHNRPSGEVAEAVLAACALASGGLLRGFTRHAFPYTDLTKIDDLLQVPGFVAGVTNPTFENHPEWWDLICDLPTGRMKISSKLEQPETTEGLTTFQEQNPTYYKGTASQALLTQDATGDVAFMERVMHNIANKLGEGMIRSMWRDWIVKLARLTAVFEEIVYGASALYMGGKQAAIGAYGLKGHGYVWSDEVSRQRELAGNVNRIEGWRQSRAYFTLIEDLVQLEMTRPIRSVDLHHQHDRLRTQKLSTDDAADIYVALEKVVRSPKEISQLLTVTPESHGGLFYLSLGFVHPRKDVRWATVELFDRIREHEAGKHFWNNLGRFAQMSFARIKKDKEQPREGSEDSSGEVSRSASHTARPGVAY